MMMRDTPAWYRRFFSIAAQLDVLVQQPAVVVAVGEPAAVPGAVDAEPKPDRIDFLTH